MLALLKLEVTLGFRGRCNRRVGVCITATAEIDTGMPFGALKSRRNQVVVWGTLILTSTAQLSP